MPVEVGPRTLARWKRALAARHVRRRGAKRVPRGATSAYAGKQKRQAEPIAEGYRRRRVSKRTVKARRLPRIDKMSGGGQKRGGRGRKTNASSARKGDRSGGRR